MSVRTVPRRTSAHWIVGASLAVSAALLFAPHGFAPDVDVDRIGKRHLQPAWPPLPALWSEARECDGGDGSGKGEPARPVGDPGNWVVSDDYPLVALRNSSTGRTRFSLSVDSGGGVEGCDVTASSGTASLDTAACFALTRRARFTPARDGLGCPIPSTYRSAVVWQLPPG